MKNLTSLLKHSSLVLASACMFQLNTASAQTVDGLIDFEQGNFNGTHNPTDNVAVDNAYFSSVYGITFSTVGGGTPRYAKIGAPMTAFSVHSSVPMSPYTTVKGSGSGCSGTTAYKDHPVGTALDEGCYFLTDDDGVVASNPKTIRIDYDKDIQRCTVASGYLIDVDGNEAFHIRAYTNGNFGTPEEEILLVSPVYAGPTLPSGVTIYNDPNNPTGDALSAYWEINTSNLIDRIEIDFVGSSSASVGIAFDEFSYCTASNCLVDAEVHLINDNDGSGRIRLFDQSVTNSNTTIVSRTWTVETISTDRQYYPGGTSFDFFVPVSDHYLVCLEVTAINNTTGECCTSRACEWFYVNVDQEPCAMDPDFSYYCYTDDCLFQFRGSSGNSNRNVRGWYWTFGDGSSSNVKEPIKTYSSPGTYEVCLTVTGELYEATTAEGECCVATYCRTITFNCEGVDILPTACDQGSQGGPTPARKKNEGIGVIAKPDSDVKMIDQMRLVPNPVNNEAQLNFELLEEGQVNISLISLASGAVVELVNAKTMGAGNHQLEIDGSDLPSGTYVLKLQSGNESKAVRMVIAK